VYSPKDLRTTQSLFWQSADQCFVHMVAPRNATSQDRACCAFSLWLLCSRVHVSNHAVQQVRVVAKETHDSLQHSKNRSTNKTTLSGVLFGFPLSELLNAAMHLCCVADTPVTLLNQQTTQTWSCKL